MRAIFDAARARDRDPPGGRQARAVRRAVSRRRGGRPTCWRPHDLLELAARRGRRAFVYPSSDKSVQPPSVYGATKRLAEGLVQTPAQAQRRRWAIVRYVNIIGTRGSVIETFTQQVLADRPLSVTDERMTRYWISMDEAIWCVAAGGAVRGSRARSSCPPVASLCRLLETARRLAGWYRPEQRAVSDRCAPASGRANGCTRCCCRRTSRSPTGPAPGLRSVRTHARLGAARRAAARRSTSCSALVDSGDREALARTLPGGGGRAAVNPIPWLAAGVSWHRRRQHVRAGAGRRALRTAAGRAGRAAAGRSPALERAAHRRLRHARRAVAGAAAGVRAARSLSDRSRDSDRSGTRPTTCACSDWCSARCASCRWRCSTIAADSARCRSSSGSSLIAAVPVAFGLRVSSIAQPFGDPIELPVWLDIPVSILWFVGMMNAINWVDVMDGLAGGVAFGGAHGAVRARLPVHRSTRWRCFPLALAGVCLGFLGRNRPPATIFMGSSGSLLLGFGLAGSGILGGAKVGTAILVLGVPILDAAWVIFRRLTRGARPTVGGDREHLPMKLHDLGLSTGQTVLAAVPRLGDPRHHRAEPAHAARGAEHRQALRAAGHGRGGARGAGGASRWRSLAAGPEATRSPAPLAVVDRAPPAARAASGGEATEPGGAISVPKPWKSLPTVGTRSCAAHASSICSRTVGASTPSSSTTSSPSMPAATTAGRYVAPVLAVQLVRVRPRREAADRVNESNRLRPAPAESLRSTPARRGR